MKKKLIILFTFIFFSFFFVEYNVEAASWSISPRNGSIKSGGSLTIRISGDVAGRFDVSTSGNCRPSNNRVFKETISSNATFTVTATGSGSCSVKVSAYDVSDSSYNSVGGSSSANFTITSSNSSSSSSNKNSSSSKNSSTSKDPSKSSNNNLKSLSVEGAALTFNKDTVVYNLSVGNDVKNIKINAEVADPKATLTGTGEKEVKEGDNKFEVVVTAENGDTKTYTININVDSKPITVTVGGKKYTLVKKKEELPELSIEHEDLTLNFEGQEVPAYRIDKINFVLVGLRDEEGNIKLYKYDSYKDNEKPDKYTLFRQFTLPQMLISYLDFPKKLIPNGFKKYTEEINGEKVEVYKLSKNSDYSLFYGINIETGKKNIYKYDSKEKTIQIYDKEQLKSLEKQIKEYKYIIVGLIGFVALLLIIIVLIIATRRRKFKKMIRKYENKKMAQL